MESMVEAGEGREAAGGDRVRQGGRGRDRVRQRKHGRFRMRQRKAW